MPEVAASSRDGGERHRTIAAQDQGQGAGFYGLLDPRLQYFDRFQNCWNIPRARAFRIGVKNLRRIIAVIHNFVTGGAEPLNQSRRA